MSNQHTGQQASVQPKRRQTHEGPQKHIISFLFSLALTAIAFAVVGAADMNRTFTLVILVVMAILQVIIQLAFWMHMKDKGHFFPIAGIAAGCFVMATMVVMALYWVFW